MEFKDKQSIYLQIADYICEQILLGKWPPNERIPSVRDFGGMLEVNPNTVMRTYDFLQNKEIIFNKRGIGYSVSEDAQQRILIYKKERFLESELPEVFKTLYLLNITMDEVKTLYDQFVVDTFPLNN
ncbi:GntR family transcriptional regulator [Dyadobacter fanqingshengii]|uniref:GntR family transcriptional regulator n=1 Tax=Dyadobacter fanqingshengii TaxID=2906443 RepID=A0A9X1P7Y9_9BACT|nr:GntR family transcriptional regulator [Dyadobacter fanqingshengii]MCF0039647.1 GntR family transcriptional regulator [Dyadobacter fanqingshengii]MCF2502815.1 GntR family transcriptional regulator [Dyadobacter fanqingshengii]USJ38587.1 GntR family transcriptional regulator [Dyadobacter fanqingshengii]